MARPLKPATALEVSSADNALACLRCARDWAKAAGATQTLRRINAAINSAEGAARHVRRRRSATEEMEAAHG